MTEAQTADLAAWLTAIWDEEERLATDDLTPGPWTLEYECPEGEHHHDWDEAWVSGWHGATVGSFNERYTSGPRDAAHVVRQQPSQVLARIAADRKILAEHRIEEVVSIEPETRGRAFLVCRRCRSGERQLVWPCTTARLLAEPYVDREGFSPEWLVERQGVEQG